MAKKATFGSLSTAKVRYVIVIYYLDNTVKFVTDVLYEPHKECLWEWGKQAEFFLDRKYAEDICFGLNANGTGAFVMEVPDYFDDEHFKNPEDPGKKDTEQQNIDEEKEEALNG